MQNIHSVSTLRALCIVLLASITLAGCSSTPKAPAVAEKVVAPVEAPPEVQTIDEMSLLLAHYDQWKGVPYQLGGTTAKGIDCSGYIQRLFEDTFAEMLPRTTVAQVQQGVPVKRDELQTGDLVFFKVSRRTNHVGVYLENGKFLHASTSKGVIISKLNNPYWRERYWTSRRIESRG